MIIISISSGKCFWIPEMQQLPGPCPLVPHKGLSLGSRWAPKVAPKPPAAQAVDDATALFSPYRLCPFGGLFMFVALYHVYLYHSFIHVHVYGCIYYFYRISVMTVRSTNIPISSFSFQCNKINRNYAWKKKSCRRNFLILNNFNITLIG